MLRRAWLIALSVGSLVILLYASIAMALSVPVTEDMARANQVPGEPALAGARALLVPIPDPNEAKGQLVVGGDSVSGFPSGADNATMGRVLEYVAPTANGSYVPRERTYEVTRIENGTLVKENVTVDVAALAGGASGYVVKGDVENEPRFLAKEATLGAVGRFESPYSLMAMFSFGGVGFVAPLLFIILTHRRTGKPGVPTSITGCPECRRPIEAGAEFCTACGAWLRKAS